MSNAPCKEWTEGIPQGTAVTLVLVQRWLMPGWHQIYVPGIAGAVVGLVAGSSRYRKDKSMSLTIPWESIDSVKPDVDNPGGLAIRVKHFRPSGILHFTPSVGLEPLRAAIAERIGKA